MCCQAADGIVVVVREVVEELSALLFASGARDDAVIAVGRAFSCLRSRCGGHLTRADSPEVRRRHHCRSPAARRESAATWSTLLWLVLLEIVALALSFDERVRAMSCCACRARPQATQGSCELLHI